MSGNENFSIQYSISAGDYRAASYYGLVMRNRRSLKITALFFGLFVVYAILTAVGFLPLHPMLKLLGFFYLLWLLFLIGSVEKGIFSYRNSKDSLIGEKYRLTKQGYHLQIELPAKNFRYSTAIKKITAFELRSIFLLYVDAQQVFIVPKRAFTAEQLAGFRESLRSIIPDWFVSRY